MPNNPKAAENLVPMKKGYDPRRNLRGVPKTAKALKERIEKIGAELLVIKEKIPVPGTDEFQQVEYDLTRMDAMLRRMYSSNSPADRKEILERVAGKVPQAVALTGADGGPLLPQPETMKPSEIAAEVVKQLAAIEKAVKHGDT